ncbi:MAG TPA: pyridoxal phosphate-dependent aminotransferase [Pyrinomonadaceae bacterium]|nr:pyridoxal phosphate-dependent aminotransferase [Pyrinomonadaceae bacterium]
MTFNGVKPDLIADLGLGHIKLNDVAPQTVPICGFEYGPAEGMPPLREAIAVWEGVSVEEIIVTTGASLGLVAVMATLERPGSILCPRPHYPAYPKVAHMLGFEVIYYDLEEAQQWQPNPEQIARLVRKDTRALLWNFPNNPTGSLPPASLLEGIPSLISRTDLVIISDEVYADLVYDGVSFPDAKAVFKNSPVIRLRSFSKLFGMPGERLGYVIADADRAQMICRAHWSFAMSSPATAQAIALRLLSLEPEKRVEKLCAALADNRNRVMQILADCRRIKCLTPAAGIFCWIEAPNCSLDSRSLARTCASDAGVIVVPGAAFGMDNRTFLRASFAVPKEEAIRGFVALSTLLDQL